MKKHLVFPLLTLALLSALIFVFDATAAQPQQVLSSQQQAILNEAWTLTPQWTAKAGF